MWPFRRRQAPLLESVRIGTPSKEPTDYPVLTVGQSRLADSFTALGFTNNDDDTPRFTFATLNPIIDPRMKVVADIEVQVEGFVVGYLRPPALDNVISLLRDARASTVEVPAVVMWGPTGPDVCLRIEDTKAE